MHNWNKGQSQSPCGFSFGSLRVFFHSSWTSQATLWTKPAGNMTKRFKLKFLIIIKLQLLGLWKQSFFVLYFCRLVSSACHSLPPPHCKWQRENEMGKHLLYFCFYYCVVQMWTTIKYNMGKACGRILKSYFLAPLPSFAFLQSLSWGIFCMLPRWRKVISRRSTYWAMSLICLHKISTDVIQHHHQGVVIWCFLL